MKNVSPTVRLEKSLFAIVSLCLLHIHDFGLFSGPHFSYSYFIAVNGIVGPILGLISVALYEKFLSSWRFRSVLIFTYAIWCFVPVVDIIIITRLNQAIGISDKVLYFFGEAIGIQLIGTCHYIPMSAIYSKMSPPGMESTVYG